MYVHLYTFAIYLSKSYILHLLSLNFFHKPNRRCRYLFKYVNTVCRCTMYVSIKIICCEIVWISSFIFNYISIHSRISRLRCRRCQQMEDYKVSSTLQSFGDSYSWRARLWIRCGVFHSNSTLKNNLVFVAALVMVVVVVAVAVLVVVVCL